MEEDLLPAAPTFVRAAAAAAAAGPPRPPPPAAGGVYDASAVLSSDDEESDGPAGGSQASSEDGSSDASVAAARAAAAAPFDWAAALAERLAGIQVARQQKAGAGAIAAATAAASGGPSLDNASRYGAGYALLRKMGYSGAGGLGKEGEGPTAPLEVRARGRNKGLDAADEGGRGRGSPERTEPRGRTRAAAAADGPPLLGAKPMQWRRRAREPESPRSDGEAGFSKDGAEAEAKPGFEAAKPRETPGRDGGDADSDSSLSEDEGLESGDEGGASTGGGAGGGGARIGFPSSSPRSARLRQLRLRARLRRIRHSPPPAAPLRVLDFTGLEPRKWDIRAAVQRAAAAAGTAAGAGTDRGSRRFSAFRRNLENFAARVAAEVGENDEKQRLLAARAERSRCRAAAAAAARAAAVEDARRARRALLAFRDLMQAPALFRAITVVRLLEAAGESPTGLSQEALDRGVEVERRRAEAEAKYCGGPPAAAAAAVAAPAAAVAAAAAAAPLAARTKHNLRERLNDPSLESPHVILNSVALAFTDTLAPIVCELNLAGGTSASLDATSEEDDISEASPLSGSLLKGLIAKLLITLMRIVLFYADVLVAVRHPNAVDTTELLMLICLICDNNHLLPQLGRFRQLELDKRLSAQLECSVKFEGEPDRTKKLYERWRQILPSEEFARLVCSSLFPKWHDQLDSLLDTVFAQEEDTRASAAVLSFYTAWRATFEQFRLQFGTIVESELVRGLLKIDAYISRKRGEVFAGGPASRAGQTRAGRDHAAEDDAPEPGRQVLAALEAAAAARGLFFAPRPRRFFNGMQVYDLASSSICVQDEVVYRYRVGNRTEGENVGSSKWSVVSLETLLGELDRG